METKSLEERRVESIEGFISSAPIHVIASCIRDEWKKPYFGAVPYLEAMFSLTTVDSPYMFETGRDIIPYFLANATTWRGPMARLIKGELKKRLAK